MAKRQNIVTHRKYCLSQYFKPKLQTAHSPTRYFDAIPPSPTNSPHNPPPSPKTTSPLPSPTEYLTHTPPNQFPSTDTHAPILQRHPLIPTSLLPPPIPSAKPITAPFSPQNEKRFIFFLSKPPTEANLRAPHQESSGQVSEWSNEHAWKVCVLATVPRVRIPPCPPLIFRCNIFVMSILRFLFTGVWKKITGRNWTAIMHPCYLMLYSQQFFYEK